MSITLQTFNANDTDYVSKLNNNVNQVQAAINTLQTTTSTGATGATSNSSLFSGLFGGTPVLVGSSSYAATFSGSTVTLSAGSTWKPSTNSLVSIATSTPLNFTGQTAGTYYISVDATGTPSYSSTSSTDAMYSVAWNGTAVTGVTQIAGIFMSAAEQTALLHSTTNNTTYPSLLARLEAIETLLNTKS